MLEKKITFDSFIRGIITILIIIGVLYLVNYLSGVLLPFFVAWLIAYMAYPMVTFFQYKLKLKNRVVSIILTMIVLLTVLTLAFVLLAPPIIDEFGKLKELLRAYFIEGSKQAAIPGTVENFIKEHVNMMQIQSALSEENMAKTLQDLLPKAWSIFAHSVNILVSIFAAFIVMLYTFFILLDYETIANGWVGLVPIKYREVTVRIVNDVKEGMNRYFRGQALVAFLVGILFSIGFLIIDFPIAIGFGLFIGMLNLVPYLQLVSLLPMTLLSLIKAANTGDNFWVILVSALAVTLIIQAIQDFILVPQIMGRRMKLHPAVILLSLAIWGKLLGIIGMIVALPLTTLILGYIKQHHQRNMVVRERKMRKTKEKIEMEWKDLAPWIAIAITLALSILVPFFTQIANNKHQRKMVFSFIIQGY